MDESIDLSPSDCPAATEDRLRALEAAIAAPSGPPYRYFVSYWWRNPHAEGFGACEVVSPHRLTSGKRTNAVARQIAQSQELADVVLLSWQLFEED